MQTNLGEISRHLAGTTIGHRADDIQFFPQDYPILPVRRRFWENTLRVLDQTGTDSQLRNQLSMIHKVIQTNVDAPVGSVVPADYLYFDAADKLLQSRILPRKVHEKTMVWAKGTDDQRLMARSCGLVFSSTSWPAATTKSAFVPPSTPWPTCWWKTSPKAPARCAASSRACSTSASY